MHWSLYKYNYLFLNLIRWDKYLHLRINRMDLLNILVIKYSVTHSVVENQADNNKIDEIWIVIIKSIGKCSFIFYLMISFHL